MSYSYLLDLYQVLDERLCEIAEEQENSAATMLDQHYLRGRHDCLAEFKDLLHRNYHHKLPRRIQKTLGQDSKA